jgi:hypothetical protein
VPVGQLHQVAVAEGPRIPRVVVASCDADRLVDGRGDGKGLFSRPSIPVTRTIQLLNYLSV